MNNTQDKILKLDNHKSYFKSLVAYQAYKYSKEEAQKRAEENMTKILTNLGIAH